jgi:hypothetical protein
VEEILEDCFVINPEFYGMLFSISLVVAYSIYLIEKSVKKYQLSKQIIKEKKNNVFENIDLLVSKQIKIDYFNLIKNMKKDVSLQKNICVKCTTNINLPDEIFNKGTCTKCGKTNDVYNPFIYEQLILSNEYTPLELLKYTSRIYYKDVRFKIN